MHSRHTSNSATGAFVLTALLVGGCIQRANPDASAGATRAPIPAERLQPRDQRPAEPVAGPAAPARLAPQVGGPFGDATALARLRAWLDTTVGAEPYRDGTITIAHEHDTPQARCFRAVPAGAPDPRPASRMLCVVGDDVLSGDSGFQRFLQMHQFDVNLARPSVPLILQLRDAMLGLWGRTYTRIEPRTVNGRLIVDVEGTALQAVSGRIARARWTVTFESDGSSAESPR